MSGVTNAMGMNNCMALRVGFDSGDKKIPLGRGSVGYVYGT